MINCHTREGGYPVSNSSSPMDSRLRGNDGYFERAI